jgi:hypothetical protein
MTQPMPAMHTYAPARGTRPTTPWVAIAALAIGISAFVLAWVPALGAFLGLAGLVLGIIALVSRRSAVMSAIATGLSVLAVLIGAWTTVVGVQWLADLEPSSWDSYASDDYGYEDDEDYSYEGDGEYYGDDDYGYYPRTGPGSFDDPLTQPRTVQYAGENAYTVSARLADDVDATVLGWSEFNEPAPEGYRWVLMEATITGRSDEGTKPAYADYDLMIASGPNEFHYSESFTLPEDIPYLDDQRTLGPGETFTGVSAYLVPADATELRLADGQAFIKF